ncbi:class I poly(R)-hydroxyalkanoic acid synthase [Pseudolabrys taiwanensis]|uniref:Class I poly(R)-hydroxyalkanoic acid synthase n=1 Tax=Pseudolabrys taiwanensis TaxID=331696 RepID=A0A345ZS03_9HYPH|nr:class I poly(R)-hydroxyalkanoic acid synthase [Pseudolabrys taiwanensis]
MDQSVKEPGAVPGRETPALTSADIEAFARNAARMVEEGGKALAAYLRPREEGKIKPELADDISDVVRTIGQVIEYWLSDPQRATELQASLGHAFLGLWAQTAKRLAGETAEPVIAPDPKDKRFADPEWSRNQFYDFLKQVYLLTTQWAERLVKDAELDERTRKKAEFYIRQIANAISPSNFVLTNPELMRETLSSHGENLVRGMQLLSEDIQAGEGYLKIRQSDPSLFEVGRNLAVTPGKVIFQNELMQLIQYQATTTEVLKTPLLIVPPWINKFYILDLNPEKSFIKWCVDQGITVFTISWVNPDGRLAEKSFEQYMRDGVIAAMDAVKEITGEPQLNAIGYCVGGTLLSITLAYLAAKKQDRVKSATFFAAQVDFTYAGDLLVFVDEAQIKHLEGHMKAQGYLEASRMANAFNMLRSNDLVWPYIVNNYLRGKKPLPFDILYWNSDATRMPAANHSFYLRNCYLDNKLTKGKMELGRTKLDLRKVKIPVYDLATREDHIAPAKSVLHGAHYFGGPVRFVLAGSGHIAGVINPPAKPKYQYWTGDKPKGSDVDAWLKTATEHPGSWWPDWLDWLKAVDAETVPAREIGGGKLKAIEDAPGSYVKVKSWA